MHLTATDIKKLTGESSGAARGALAGKIALDYRDGHFSASEEKIANDIFRLLLKDTETRVRRALAEQLAHCPQVPHDIIVKLANDRTEIAAPVLEYSDVLTEDDLVAVIKSTHEVAKLRAIARRSSVSMGVADRLIDTRQEEVLVDLFSNKGAVLAEDKLAASFNALRDHPLLLEALVKRGGLPMPIAEKLFAAVSEEMKQHLASEYGLTGNFVHKAVNDAREWEMLGLTPSPNPSDLTNEEYVDDLIDELHMNGRLTHSLIIRALCTGNLNIFEAGIARLAGVPRVNARILLLDSSGMGFAAIYKKSAMPEGFFEAVKLLLRICLEESEYGRSRADDFKKRIIDRIYIGKYHRSVENMEYLLSIIGGKIVAAAQLH